MYLNISSPQQTPTGLKIRFSPVSKENICYIKLANSRRKVIIDSDDYHKVCYLVWRIIKSGCIISKFRCNNIFLGKLILGVTDNVLHIDKNPLNNRKSNLRIARTKEENKQYSAWYLSEYRKSKRTPILNKRKKSTYP